MSERPSFGKWALAAGVALFIATTAYFGYQAFAGYRYSTPVGGVASLPLEDGSTITLNTATRVRVLLSQEQRLIKLDGGEAFFDVAKDPARPFIVQSGDRRIIALGTRFSVRRDGADVKIVVTDGKVRLEREEPSSQHPAHSEGKAAGGEILLTAGAVAETRNDKLTVQQRALPKAEELLSWRTGYLVFQETTLADAVAEFNRYNERVIRIPDPSTAGIRISGKFRSTNFESFVRLLQDSHQISARRSADTIVLTEETTAP